MDPTHDWYYKTYMDAREFGVGLSAFSLDPLNDCPRNDYYMDAFYIGADGKLVKISDAFCIFERYSVDVSWRHTEVGIPNLVVSNLYVIGFLIVDSFSCFWSNKSHLNIKDTS